jgi:hypothetical protein
MSMSKPIVIDQFAPYELFSKLNDFVNSQNITWLYTPYTIGSPHIKEDLYNWQLSRPMYDASCGGALDSAIEVFAPLIDKIQPQALLRLKLNLNRRTKEPRIQPWHTDFSPSLNITTAVYYLNSNNGYTEIETGEKIESKENRIVFFSGLQKHRGVTCTDDQKHRIVLNINFMGGKHSNEI